MVLTRGRRRLEPGEAAPTMPGQPAPTPPVMVADLPLGVMPESDLANPPAATEGDPPGGSCPPSGSPRVPRRARYCWYIVAPSPPHPRKLDRVGLLRGTSITPVAISAPRQVSPSTCRAALRPDHNHRAAGS